MELPDYFMKTIVLNLLRWSAIALLLSFICSNQNALAQTVPVINLDQLDSRLQNGADTTFVVNFWATWCGPCVKELPYFETLGSNNADEKMKVLLVTLDFVENLDSKVIPFIAKKGDKKRSLASR